MKRACKYTELTEKRKRLEAEIRTVKNEQKDLYAAFLTETRRQSELDRVRFFSERPLMRYKSFDPDYGVRNESNQDFLTLLFESTSDVIPLVLIHLGPMELTQLRCISPFYDRIVTNTFFLLAPTFLDHYCYDVLHASVPIRENGVENCRGDIKELLTILTNARESETKGASLADLLQLWHAFHFKYRRYWISRSNDDSTTDYIFVCDFDNTVFRRLSDTNALYTPKYREVTRMMIARLGEPYGPLVAKEIAMENPCMDLFNYDELAALEIVSPMDFPVFTATAVPSIVRDDSGKRIEPCDYLSTLTILVLQPKGVTTHLSYPCFDIYELRHEARQMYGHTNVGIATQTLESLLASRKRNISSFVCDPQIFTIHRL